MFAVFRDFNMMHSRNHEIYKINVFRDLQGRMQEYGITPIALGPMIANDISGIESLVRVNTYGSPIKHGNEIFDRRVAYSDPDFFEVFDYPLISGNYESFQGKGNIMISEKLAGIHFGEANPVGELITVYDNEGNPFDYIIGAVYKDIPQNSSMQFDAITLFENYLYMLKLDENDWRYFAAATFLVIPNPDQAAIIDEKIDEIIPAQNKANENWKIIDFKLLPFKEMILVVVVRNQSHYEIFRQPLLQNPKILSVAGSNYHVGCGNYRRGVEYRGMKHEVNVMNLGPGYMETIGMDLLQVGYLNKNMSNRMPLIPLWSMKSLLRILNGMIPLARCSHYRIRFNLQ